MSARQTMFKIYDKNRIQVLYLYCMNHNTVLWTREISLGMRSDAFTDKKKKQVGT